MSMPPTCLHDSAWQILLRAEISAIMSSGEESGAEHDESPPKVARDKRKGRPERISMRVLRCYGCFVRCAWCSPVRVQRAHAHLLTMLSHSRDSLMLLHRPHVLHRLSRHCTTLRSGMERKRPGSHGRLLRTRIRCWSGTITCPYV